MSIRKFISIFISPILKHIKTSANRLIFNKGGFGRNTLDIDVINIIQPLKGGFFVELGANDGVRQSNTFLLQKNYSWGGILTKPNPARFEECVFNSSYSRNVSFIVQPVYQLQLNILLFQCPKNFRASISYT